MGFKASSKRFIRITQADIKNFCPVIQRRISRRPEIHWSLSDRTKKLFRANNRNEIDVELLVWQPRGVQNDS